MRTSPLFMATIYTLMGILFVYVAISRVQNASWDFISIIMAIVATFDFSAAIRLVSLHFRIKRSQNKKK